MAFTVISLAGDAGAPASSDAGAELQNTSVAATN